MNNHTQQIVAKAWNFAHVLRDDGVGYMSFTEQITFLLFLKMADEQTRPPYNRPRIVPVGLDWPSLLARDGDDLEVHYRHVLEQLGREPGMLGAIFKKARPEIQDPAKLRRLIAELIDKENWFSLQADVKGQDGPPGAARQHCGPGFGHVARPARPVDGERNVAPLFEPLRHHGQSPQAAPRRTALRGAVAQPLDHPARPLPVEVGRIHEDNAPVPEIPRQREIASVPKRPDIWRFPGSIIVSRAFPPEDFKTDRRSQDSNGGPHDPGNDRDLQPSPARELGKTSVVMDQKVLFFFLQGRFRRLVHEGIV